MWFFLYYFFNTVNINNVRYWISSENHRVFFIDPLHSSRLYDGQNACITGKKFEKYYFTNCVFRGQWERNIILIIKNVLFEITTATFCFCFFLFYTAWHTYACSLYNCYTVVNGCFWFCFVKCTVSSGKIAGNEDNGNKRYVFVIFQIHV